MRLPRLWPSQNRTELQRLRENEARYRVIAASASDLIVELGLDGRILYVSPSAIRLGHRPEDLIGRLGIELIHPDERDRYLDRMGGIVAGVPIEPGTVNTFRIQRGDGQWAWTNGNPLLLHDDKGRLRGVLSVLRDVSAQKALESRLAASEASYRQLADHASDIIVHYDLEGVIHFASPSISRLGFTPDEVVGRNTRDFCHPDDLRQMVRSIGAAVRGDRRPSEGWPEVRFRTADGGWIWCEGNPGMIRDDDGEVIGVVTVLRDVTERRRLADAVRERETERRDVIQQLAGSELRYRVLADQSPDVIIRYDVNGWIDYMSPAVRRYGFQPEELIGRNIGDLIDPSDNERNREWMADLAAGRPVPQGAANVWRTEMGRGRVIWWEGATTPLVGDDGKVIGAMSVLRDVTDRVALEEVLWLKHAETEQTAQRLADSEARYRMITESAADLIVSINQAGDITFATPSAQTFGFEPEELVGRRWMDFVHPDDVDHRVAQALRAGEKPPSGPDNQFRLLCKNGAYAWVQGSPSAVRDADGRVQTVVSVVRDISAQVGLEDELRRKRAEAEAATIAKSEFLANMSHEIRTPLTAMVGFAGLLGQLPELPDVARRYLDRIVRGGQALTAIVNNILDFSKIEAGQAEISAQPFNPAEFIEASLDLVRERASLKGLTLEWSAEGPLPDLVSTDPDRLRQVLLNLLTNAVKFTVTGGVHVTVGHSAERLRIAVADTGPGVPPSQAGRLFQRFSQIDGSNARRYGGAGLGLAISKGLMALMHGEIGYQPREGGGSLFWLTAPAPALQAAPPAPVEPDPTPGPDRTRILVVDDAPINRELILALLSPFAVEALEASDGREAVTAAAAERFDLILMDLQMPGMDGIAAAEAIRKSGGPNTDTPIIAVSASVQPADVEACRRAGMNDHVPKPISARDLLGKVARWTAAETGAAA